MSPLKSSESSESSACGANAPVGKRIQHGFSLVEMGLVLILISLVLSGTLRGAELINSAHISGLVADFQNVQRFLNTYQDQFRFQPGDDLKATAHIGADALPGNGNGAIDGNWYDSGAASEASRTWQHIRLAGFVRGATEFAAADYPPLNVLGQPMGIQGGSSDPAMSPIKNAQGGAISGSRIMCSRGIPGKLALALDIRIDDGNPATGAMLATLDTGTAYTLGSAAATLAKGAATDLRHEEHYIVCMGV